MAQERPSTLREAVDLAWLRQPMAQAAAMRRAELEARQDAAESLMRDAPAVTLENWSDRWTRDQGFAKYAGEFAFPLWLPGERERTRASLGADRAYVEAVITATRLNVAGEVREAFWLAKLAEHDVEIARQRRDEAEQLALDVQRRLKAGVVARLDAQTALAHVQIALAALAQAESAAFRARRSFERLTGLRELPVVSEEIGDRSFDRSLERHPLLEASLRAVDAARASLNLVVATHRDSPELGIGMFRERGRSATPFENIVTLRLRIPLATESRNAPRTAAANAFLIEAQARAGIERDRLSADLDSAERELAAARGTIESAKRRRDLAADNRRLIARAFDLGEADLPTRIRAQTEFFEAELAARRALTESLRAESRLAQAQGVMP